MFCSSFLCFVLFDLLSSMTYDNNFRQLVGFHFIYFFFDFISIIIDRNLQIIFQRKESFSFVGIIFSNCVTISLSSLMSASAIRIHPCVPIKSGFYLRPPCVCIPCLYPPSPPWYSKASRSLGPKDIVG